MIKKELNNLYVLEGNTEAVIKTTATKQQRRIKNYVSEYSPSESVMMNLKILLIMI